MGPAISWPRGCTVPEPCTRPHYSGLSLACKVGTVETPMGRTQGPLGAGTCQQVLILSQRLPSRPTVVLATRERGILSSVLRPPGRQSELGPKHDREWALWPGRWTRAGALSQPPESPEPLCTMRAPQPLGQAGRQSANEAAGTESQTTVPAVSARLTGSPGPAGLSRDPKQQVHWLGTFPPLWGQPVPRCRCEPLLLQDRLLPRLRDGCVH